MRCHSLCSLPEWLTEDTSPGAYSDVRVLPPGCLFAASGERLFVRCPERENFWFGNFALLRDPPRQDSEWQALRQGWQRHIGDRCRVPKIVFQWDEAGPEPFDQALPTVFGTGIELFSARVMALDRPVPPPPPGSYRFLRLERRTDFDQALRIVLADLAGSPQDAATGDFIEWQHRRRWEAVSAGRAVWFGLMREDELVVHCGLADAGSLGRYRDVITAHRYRRRGLAERLCRAVAHEAMAEGRFSRLIIVAESGSSAERIYARPGFRTIGYQYALVIDRETPPKR